MSSCPVCLGRVTSALLSRHMASHSKEEILSALISRQEGPGAASGAANNSVGMHFMAQQQQQRLQASQPPPASRFGPSPGSSSSPYLFMPQMMGLMQVLPSATPCLIPQPNGGPPILVNMPSYVYNPAAAAAAGIPNLLLPPNTSSFPPAPPPSSSSIVLPTEPVASITEVASPRKANAAASSSRQGIGLSSREVEEAKDLSMKRAEVRKALSCYKT